MARLHGRIDDGIDLPAPGPFDAPGDEAAVRDERAGPRSGAHVPAAKPRRESVRRGARERARPALAEVDLELVPDVPHRRVHVADVAHAGPGLCALGDGVAGGDDEVVGTQIEGLDGGRKERQVVAVAGAREGKALQEAGRDAMALDDRSAASRYVQQGEDVRVREDAAEDLEHALAAAQPGEPVVHQRDPLHGMASR